MHRTWLNVQSGLCKHWQQQCECSSLWLSGLKIEAREAGRRYSSLLYLGKAPCLDRAMQGGTLQVCTMGDEVNPCVAHRGRPCRRLKGVSVAYGLADATTAHYLLLQLIQIGFTRMFLLFWCWLTQVILEERPFNECSSSITLSDQQCIAVFKTVWCSEFRIVH